MVVVDKSDSRAKFNFIAKLTLCKNNMNQNFISTCILTATMRFTSAPADNKSLITS